MKRFLVFAVIPQDDLEEENRDTPEEMNTPGYEPSFWFLQGACDTLLEAVAIRERSLHEFEQPTIIVEYQQPLEAYAMAHREAAAEQIRVAYGKPR